MPDVHPIRLRGPWEMVLADCSDSIAKDVEPRRVKMPARLADVLGESFSGRARFERKFGEPTAIEPHEKVWLLIDTPHELAGALLNEKQIEFKTSAETPQRLETEITSRLSTRNRLLFEVGFRAGERECDCPLLGEVWLEIRSGSG